MDPGVILRQARVRAGLSQAELARRAGTAQPVISVYEHGGRDPGVATLRKLIAAAGSVLELRVRPPAAAAVPLPRDDNERGERLVDVLLLADAIGSVRAGPLSAPRMSCRRG